MDLFKQATHIVELVRGLNEQGIETLVERVKEQDNLTGEQVEKLKETLYEMRKEEE